MKILFSILISTIILTHTLLFAEDSVDKLIFSHKQHVVDAGAECTDCHSTTAANEGNGKNTLPTEETCKKCHEEAFTEKNCALCHTNSANVKPALHVLLHKNFSHKSHLKQNVKCAFCHKDIEKTVHATAKNLPNMEICFTCHNDKTASRNCRACHLDPSLKKPTSHNVPNFEGRVHGRDARFSKQLCEQCHEESSCDKCHRGQDKRKIHRPDIRFTHGFEAKKGDKNCTLCHESERFCAKCHEARK